MPNAPTHRLLQVEFGTSQIKETPDGGLKVFGVKLLAEGTWTDSNVGSPLYYPVQTLQAYATNWTDRSLWIRHSGITPWSITDRIAEIEDIRFESDAVVGDLFFHGRTQNSKDSIAYIKYCQETGRPVFVSVEHTGKERFDAAKSRWEAESLVFYGAALVNRGACKKCNLPTRKEGEKEDELMDEKKLAEFEGQIKTLAETVGKLTEGLAGVMKHLDAQAVQMKTLAEKTPEEKKLQEDLVAALERIKKLEETPNPKTGDQGEDRELAAPAEVPVRVQNGVISSEGRAL